MIKPHCSNLRIIAAIIFRSLTSSDFYNNLQLWRMIHNNLQLWAMILSKYRKSTKYWYTQNIAVIIPKI